MKKCLIIIISYSLFLSCSQPRSGNDNSHLRNPNDTISKIKTIRVGNSKIVIFPASYSKKIFTNPTKVTGVFTPNENIIKYIEENLSSNYEIMMTDAQKPYIGTKVFKKDLAKYDKQYLGFIDNNKDSIVNGIIINFESDSTSERIKQKLETDAIVCSDGWCDSNRVEFLFNLNSRKFINVEN